MQAQACHLPPPPQPVSSASQHSASQGTISHDTLDLTTYSHDNLNWADLSPRSPINSASCKTSALLIAATARLLRHANDFRQQQYLAAERDFQFLSVRASAQGREDQRRVQHPAHKLPVFCDAPVNSTGSQCLYNTHTLRIPPTATQPDCRWPQGPLLHGHSRLFDHVPDNSPIRELKHGQPAIAQAPDQFATPPGRRGPPALEWLQHALRTGKTDFVQIVARQTHRAGFNDQEVPLQGLFEHLLANAQSSRGVDLGDGWAFTAMTEHGPQGQPDVQGTVWDRDCGVTRATLHFCKAGDPGSAALSTPSQTLQLTQIAPPYSDGLLTPSALSALHAIYKEHVTQPESTVIFSRSGSGRNGVLAVYSVLADAIDSGLIDDVDTLSQALEDLTESGKRVRGDDFMGDENQYIAVFDTAHKRLTNHQTV